MAKRALLVGIDTYPDPQNNLNSCVADTLAFKKMLQDVYQFDAASIKLLHNRDATLENVLGGLDVLMAGVHSGDELVYFESSHGYRYPDGDTMVEVLCLYDHFLKDADFAAKTQSAPAGVLTVVLDSCHSGGMNKVFFPGGDVQVARAKVWTPTAHDDDLNGQLYAQVTKFKFWGHAPTSDSGAVAKSFQINPTGVPAPKDISAGAPELNGALFAACQADQTAAAGSIPTNMLSAFTYALTVELDPALSLSDLAAKVTRRLNSLNMSQVPRAVAPPMHQEVLTETFISMQPAGVVPGPTGQGGDNQPGGGDGFDPLDYLRTQLGDLMSI